MYASCLTDQEHFSKFGSETKFGRATFFCPYIIIEKKKIQQRERPTSTTHTQKQSLSVTLPCKILGEAWLKGNIPLFGLCDRLPQWPGGIPLRPEDLLAPPSLFSDFCFPPLAFVCLPTCLVEPDHYIYLLCQYMPSFPESIPTSAFLTFQLSGIAEWFSTILQFCHYSLVGRSHI